MRKIKWCFILCLTLIMFSALGVQAQEGFFSKAKNNALGYFAHGLSGLEMGVDLENAIDVWVDNKKEVVNVKFGDIIGPYSIPPGSYDVKLYRTGLGPDLGYSPVFEVTLTFKAGEKTLDVGHWNKTGDDPVVTRFPLDLSPIHDKKKARVILAHCAAAPHLTAAFYDSRSATEHPYVGNEAMESTDKFVSEISKLFKWALYVQEAKLDGSGALLYDKIFKIKPQKAYMVVILGTPKTSSFKVAVKAYNKKLK